MKTLFCKMAALAVIAPSLAFSHATFEMAKVPVNSTYKAVLRIPHGCDGSATTAVRVKLPEGLIKAKPMPKAGWALDVITGKFENTYSYYGKDVSEGPKEIVWKNGNLPDDFYDEFVFRVRVTDHFKVGETVYIPVVQTCTDGENAWVEIPKAGQDAHSVKRPAPSLKIIAAEEHHHSH